jgi:GNAT superfamily N-acetyltransferase
MNANIARCLHWRTTVLNIEPMPAIPVTYAVETRVDTDEFRHVLNASGLGRRRPVDDPARLRAMLANANLILTARVDGELVGIARAMTDFSFACYLSDLAVSDTVQGQGVGSRLIEELRAHLGPTVNLILSSVPEAVPFYQRIGMAALPDCFWYQCFPRELATPSPREKSSMG